MPSIKDNFELVMENIERSIAVSGGKDKVSLVAVTKTVSYDRITEAVKAGVKIIGENRVAEAGEKFKLVNENVTWHMIGHLQRNKISCMKDQIHIADEKRIREAFAVTRQRFEELAGMEKDPEIKYLSMGMSLDYRIAIEEGSNMVRVGSAIFGRRSST